MKGIPDSLITLLQRAAIPYELSYSSISINGLNYEVSGSTLVSGNNIIDLNIGRNTFGSPALFKSALDLIPKGWSVSCVGGGALVMHPSGSTITTSSVLPDGLTDAVDQMNDSTVRIRLLSDDSSAYIQSLTYFNNAKAPAPSALWRFCDSDRAPAAIRFTEESHPTELLSWKTGPYLPSAAGNTVADAVLRDVYIYRPLPLSEFIEAMIDLGHEDLL